MCTKQASFLGDDNGDLIGIITRGDVVRAFGRRDGEELTVEEVGSTKLVVTFPDETLHDAIALMLKHDIGRLPVVDRANHRRVLGYLGRASIMNARQRYHVEEEERARGFAGRRRSAVVDQKRL